MTTYTLFIGSACHPQAESTSPPQISRKSGSHTKVQIGGITFHIPPSTPFRVEETPS